MAQILFFICPNLIVMKKLLLLLTFCLSLSLAFAQVDTSEYNRLKREYEEYVRDEKAAFEKYKEERDKEFTEFLKKDWENFQLFAAGKPIEVPGPTKIPVFDKKRELNSAKKIPAKNISVIPQNIVPENQMQMRPIPTPETPLAKKDYDLASIDYYGKEMNFIYHNKMKSCIITGVSEPQISYFWSEISSTDYYRLIEQMLDYKNNNNLNDFAYMKLAEKIAYSINNNSNNAKLITWFLLSKSGYKIKVGYSGNNIHLLIPVVNTIYSYSFFVFENMKYYVFDKEAELKSIYTYAQDYPEANKIMNFDIYKAPVLGDDVLTRKLSFDYNDKDYNFNIQYSKNLIDFYNDYPQGEIQIFFNAGISHYAKESLDRNLDSVLNGMSEPDAANFLLCFTQNAFDYKTDGDQFGYEKFFFPEELFYYPYADCEDRSVFFSFLVNEYLRLPVAGLSYPGHIATAVKFNETIPGSYYLIDNEKYVVCDPTYINAPVGACMPEFIKSDVNIVRLKNTQVSNSTENKIWDKMQAKGFFRTNYENNIVKIAENSWYLTGIVDSITDASLKIPETESGKERLFIANVDDNAKILSLVIISGDGLLMPVGIAYSDEKIFLSGYYSKNMKIGDVEISSAYDRELFMAAFDMNNNNLWLRSSGIVHEEETANLFFAVNFDKKGNFISKENISEQSFELQNPIDVTSSDKIVVYGKYEGKNAQLSESTIYEKRESYDYAVALQNLTQQFISQKYNKNAAGLFALLTILENGKITINQKEFLASVIAVNPEFKESYPKLYKDVRDITKIKSKNGIVTIKVAMLDNFSFAGITIEDNARICINNFKNGNIQISVLSGIYFKPFIKEYKVNYFKLYKSSGDIMIDYDSDHDQKVINIKKDLLK